MSSASRSAGEPHEALRIKECRHDRARHPRDKRLPFDSFVDSFAGRLVETSGDALRRLRHNPNTRETSRCALRPPETICPESLNPKVQGSIPCASTILFVQVRLTGPKRPSA